MCWVWNKAQQKAFDEVKQAIATSGTLAYYDSSLPTTVSSDASSYGIGGTIMQEHDGILKPVAFVSRTMTDAEKRYSQIEKELLAIVWTCEKFSRYLIGIDKFRIITDHKPLVPIINDKDLDVVPARCVRLLIRYMRFSGIAEHAPGKSMVIADLLSRKPLDDTTSDTDEDVRYHAISVLCSMPASTPKIIQIREESANDMIISQTMAYVIKGWPSVNEVPPALREMYAVRNSLTVIENILMYGDRMVIPSSMRDEMLMKLHAGHLGITKTTMRAKQSMWWPGISPQIEAMITNCQHCQMHRNNQRSEPLMPRELPGRPWQQVDMDLLTHRGKEYLVVSDVYSRWLEIVELTSTSSQSVIRQLKKIFSTFGYPDVMFSDNGPQFSSHDFQCFVTECNAVHKTSSPKYPQSNGGAENAVKQAKKILDQPDPLLALMEYRSTPTTVTGYSPCELLQGRRMKTALPSTHDQLKPKLPDEYQVRSRHRHSKQQQKKHYDRRNGARHMKTLEPGDIVRIRTPDQKQWGEYGKVLKRCGPRSYVIDTGNGKYRRNRKHILVVPPVNIQHNQMSFPLPVNDDNIPPHDDVQQQHEQGNDQPARQRYPVRQRRMPVRFNDYDMTR